MNLARLHPLAMTVCLSLVATAALSKPAQLVRDINQGDSSSNVVFGFSVGGSVAFGASDGTTYSLWRSDGTRTGTQKLAGGSPYFSRRDQNRPFARLGNTVVYTGVSDSGWAELWRTDGTIAGTSLLYDPGLPFQFGALQQGSFPGSCGIGYVTQGSHAFYGSGQTGMGKLFRTDGTAAGTVEIGAFPSRVCVLGAFDGKVYFSAFDPQAAATVLWRSNGQASGHSPVVDASGTPLPPPVQIVEMNGAGYFFLKSQGQVHLWRLTPGDPVPHRIVQRTWPTDGSSTPDIAAALEGVLLFRDTEIVNGVESVTKMYRSDGTPAGTYPLSVAAWWKTAHPPGIKFGTRYVYAGSSDASGLDLWTTDGTTAGTTLIRLATSGDQASIPPDYILFDGQVYVGTTRVVDGIVRGGLWRTDGTAAGTASVEDIPEIERSSSGSQYAVIGNRLLFAGYSRAEGYELWAIEADSRGGDGNTPVGGTPGGGSSGGGGAMGLDELIVLASLLAASLVLARSDAMRRGLRVVQRAASDIRGWRIGGGPHS
jgi:ELWxxDGT repeat protein